MAMPCWKFWLKRVFVVIAVAAELQQTIRQEIENNRDCQDKQKIRFFISEGKEKVKRLDEMLDMQGLWVVTIQCIQVFFEVVIEKEVHFKAINMVD